MSDTLITFADINEHALSIGDAIMYSIPQVWDEALWTVILEFESRDCLPKTLQWSFRTLVFCFMALASLSILHVLQLLIGPNDWFSRRYIEPSKSHPLYPGSLLPFQGDGTALPNNEMWTTGGIPIHSIAIGVAVMLLIWRWEDRNLEHAQEERGAETEEDDEYTAISVDDFCEDDFGRIWACIWMISLVGTIVDATLPPHPYHTYWPEVLLGVVVLWQKCPKPEIIRAFSETFCAAYPILCTREHHEDEDEDDEEDDEWVTEEVIGREGEVEAAVD